MPLPRGNGTHRGAAQLEKINCFSVFKADGRFAAAYASPQQAAAMVMLLGHGASIRDSLFEKDMLWLEGSEKQEAAVDPVYVVDMVMQRRRRLRQTQQQAD